jgi:aryl-alcohol dehydrogenase-like predicted oxidoreductase
MNLPKRPLGSSGVAITVVGFGAWAIGGGGWRCSWGPQDDAASIATMRHALGLGINWIDTAAVYGLGHSEEVIGQLLRELSSSERPMVFTKCGLVWNERDPMAEPRRILKPESIRRECDASLCRLCVDQIDLYQFHWPDETGSQLRTPGQKWFGSLTKVRFEWQESATSTCDCFKDAKPSGMWTPYNHLSP